MANLVQPVRTLSPAARCCNIAVYILNLLFGLGSIGLMKWGAYVLAENMSGDIALMFESDNFRHASFILIFAGLIVAILAICGSCAARAGNRTCLIAYFIGLMIMFIIEIIGGVTALSFYVQGTNDLERVMLTTLQRGYGIGGDENSQDDNTWAWNNIQEEYDCCGVFTDTAAAPIYLRSQWWLDQPVMSRKKVPLTCCKEGENDEPINPTHCQDPFTDYSQVYEEGCYDGVKGHADHYVIPLAAIGIAHSFLVLISLIVTYCFFRRM